MIILDEYEQRRSCRMVVWFSTTSKSRENIATGHALEADPAYKESAVYAYCDCFEAICAVFAVRKNGEP
jgi:hypothetical protein